MKAKANLIACWKNSVLSGAGPVIVIARGLGERDSTGMEEVVEEDWEEAIVLSEGFSTRDFPSLLVLLCCVFSLFCGLFCSLCSL